MKNITWNEFEKIELRTGKILSVESFPEAHKPAYIMTIDFGSKIGIKISSAQITDLYSRDELVGKTIIAVVNFPPKQIGKTISEVLELTIEEARDFFVNHYKIKQKSYYCSTSKKK